MRRFDIIWNLSLACPWDCAVCCVDAVQTADPQTTALARQEQGLELNLTEKLAVLSRFVGHDVTWNFSGGDPLVLSENLQVIEAASRMFGKENIQVSTTGAGLSRTDPDWISTYVGTLKFSYDSSDGVYQPLRPKGYNNCNLQLASRLKDVVTVAEVPLTLHNSDPQVIEQIYRNLHKAGIHRVLPMRLFPVGRGTHHKESIPDRNVYTQALDTFFTLERELGSPDVKIQCALKSLYPTGQVNPCNLYSESFGIMPDGRLNVSAWAYGCQDQALSEDFILGNLKDQSVNELLSSEKSLKIKAHLNDNFGHCKVFAYLHSNKRGVDRLFDITDPLYHDTHK